MKNRLNITEEQLDLYTKKWSDLNYWLREMEYKSISLEEGLSKAKIEMTGKSINDRIAILEKHISKAIV